MSQSNILKWSVEDRRKIGGLNARMKMYEQAVGTNLDRSYPAVLRVDGRSFSTYTKHFDKPFDMNICGALQHAAVILCEEVQNAKIGYGQSDEITVIMNCDASDSQMWFSGRVVKIVSNAASIATEAFNEYMDQNFWVGTKRRRLRARFDAKVFNIPHDEICNSLIWRQRDAIRNSKQQMGRAYFPQPQLHKKNTDQIVEMLKEKSINWDNLSLYLQRGFGVIREQYENNGGLRNRWVLDLDVPIFGEYREYAENRIHFIKDGNI